MFADELNILCEIKSELDVAQLKHDMKALQKWSNDRNLRSNAETYKVMNVGKPCDILSTQR